MAVGLACVGAFTGFAGVTEAAAASPTLTPASLQQAISTPTAQQTADQRLLVEEALQLGGTVTTTISTPLGQSLLTPGTTSSTTGDVVAATGDTCYGGVYSRTTYSVVGVNVAWTQTEVGGWCTGPGKTMIVSVNGWTFPEWIGGGMCNAYDYSVHAGEGTSDGAGHTNWAHGIHVLSVGYGVNGACATTKTIEAALRIRYDGYYDNVDDWGF
jgi:hypothetical protein